MVKKQFREVIIKNDISRVDYFFDIVGLSLLVIVAKFNRYKYISLIGFVIALIIWVNQTLRNSSDKIYEEI